MSTIIHRDPFYWMMSGPSPAIEAMEEAAREKARAIMRAERDSHESEPARPSHTTTQEGDETR